MNKVCDRCVFKCLSCGSYYYSLLWIWKRVIIRLIGMVELDAKSVWNGENFFKQCEVFGSR